MEVSLAVLSSLAKFPDIMYVTRSARSFTKIIWVVCLSQQRFQGSQSIIINPSCDDIKSLERPSRDLNVCLTDTILGMHQTAPTQDSWHTWSRADVPCSTVSWSMRLCIVLDREGSLLPWLKMAHPSCVKCTWLSAILNDFFRTLQARCKQSRLAYGTSRT